MHPVGDGDSSLYSSPVWGRYVKNIECVNHVLKNYRAKLELIVKENPGYKGAGKMTQKQIRRLKSSYQNAHNNQKCRTAAAQPQKCPLTCVWQDSKCNQAFCQVKGTIQLEEGDDKEACNTAIPSPPAESSTLQQTFDDLIQQEQANDLSPSLSSKEEEEAEEEVVAAEALSGLYQDILRHLSLTDFPMACFSRSYVQEI